MCWFATYEWNEALLCMLLLAQGRSLFCLSGILPTFMGCSLCSSVDEVKEVEASNMRFLKAVTAESVHRSIEARRMFY
jgi:hypothetical protein